MTTPLQVRVHAWTDREALAFVNEVRVRVTRMSTRIKWRCDDCGPQINTPTCPHTTALAATPVPQKKNHR